MVNEKEHPKVKIEGTEVKEISTLMEIIQRKDPILALSGLGKEIWVGVDPDDYVREMREGWE
ncbi:MAG: hypothetical protein ONB05_10270 [candidate division KSB1 bacterium]|nr:hypothetical protein [candidate division KSB1 bacterium]